MVWVASKLFLIINFLSSMQFKKILEKIQLNELLRMSVLICMKIPKTWFN